MSVVKTKPKICTNYPMNQSELEENTCNRRQGREDACEQVAIGLSFTSDWLRKWREFFLTNHRAKKSKAKAKRELIRHSVENRSILTLLCAIVDVFSTGLVIGPLVPCIKLAKSSPARLILKNLT